MKALEKYLYSKIEILHSWGEWREFVGRDAGIIIFLLSAQSAS
jgi:hypothetical protein